MCAWRYNIEDDAFELCAYYHIDGSFNPPSKALCSVKVNERFTVLIEFFKSYQRARLTIIKQDDSKYADESFFKCFGICRQVNTWFGGTKPSPHKMQMLKY